MSLTHYTLAMGVLKRFFHILGNMMR